MRKVLATGVAVLVGWGAVMACSASDPTPTETGKEPTAAGAGSIPGTAVLEFEGNVDPANEKLEIVYRSPTGEIISEPSGRDFDPRNAMESSDSLPFAALCTSNLQNPLQYTTGLTATSGVFMHTFNTGAMVPKWTTPNLTGAVCPMNLWTNPVCNFTAWIDSITITSPLGGQSVGVLDNPPGGGMTTTWSCVAGDGGGTPGTPPCSYTGYGAPAGTVAGATRDGGTAIECSSGQKPWVFHESGPGSAAGFAFSFKGHVSGDQPTH